MNFSKAAPAQTKKTRSGSGSSSDLAISEDGDDEFMNAWRQSRLQEPNTLSAQPLSGRRISPSRRTWGSLEDVDANGYLDAIEKVAKEMFVVVMIYDPSSSRSREVEDELQQLAYKHYQTRFVKLHHEIAEMETIEIPAVLVYQAGEVHTTISGARAEGLEDVLKK